MRARRDHGCSVEIFADLTAQCRVDGSEGGEGGFEPVSRVGDGKGIVFGQAGVHLEGVLLLFKRCWEWMSWIGGGCCRKEY